MSPTAELKSLFRVVKQPSGVFLARHRPTGRPVIVCPTRADAWEALEAIYLAGNPKDWQRADLARTRFPAWLKLAKEVRNAWIVGNGDTPPDKWGSVDGRLYGREG